MKIILKAVLQTRIHKQLQATYPNEGGGFLIGRVDDGTVHIEDVIPVENTYAADEQYHRYAMTPQDWAALEDTAEQRGLALVGYFHSHPDAPAVPSDFDRDHALPNFTYIIVSVAGGDPADTRAWQLRQDRSKFDSVSLTIR